MAFEEKQHESISFTTLESASSALPDQVKQDAPATAVHRAFSLRPGKKSKSAEIIDKDHALWQGDALTFLKGLPMEPMFDLVVTSPPYNIGKEYETRQGLEEYIKWQESIIDEIIPRLKKGGSVCWQVGNYVDDNQIFPLDIEFAPIFKKHKLQMRNRIICVDSSDKLSQIPIEY